MIDIAKLTAGRELDALVAEKVMGWRKVARVEAWDHGPDQKTGGPQVNWFGGPPDFPEWNNGQPVRCYSTDIAEAWLVVEKLRPGKFVWIKDCGSFGWRVEILSSNSTDVQVDFAVVADTATLAICRAALKSALNGEGK